MKKILSLVFILTFTIFLVACSNNKDFDKVFNETLIIYGQDEDDTKVTKNITFVLTSTQVEGAIITWKSNKPEVIKVNGSKGEVIRPAQDTTVELTAEVTINKKTVSKIFSVTVLKQEIAEYTVTFVYGLTTEPTTVKVKDNALVTKPTDPTREGYTFLGWYKDSEGKNPWNFQTDKITANISLYARWIEDGAPVETKLYEFDFANTNFGTSYGSNNNVNKTLPNLLGGSVNVFLARAAVNNNHSTYKDHFLVMSASVKENDNDYAFIEFNFDKKVSKMEFDVAFWSGFDAEQTTKLVLQRKSGDNWVDIKNIYAEINSTLTYVKVTIDNLDDQVLRLYAEGTDPTGAGANGARILFDNMKFYGLSVIGEDNIPPVISGANDMTFTIGASAPNWLDGVNAIDNVDGNVSVTIIENTVNLQVVGTYKITYQAKDAKGNIAEVTITVTVKDGASIGDTKLYEFDFANTNLGYSYSSNTNAEKTIPNLLGGNVNVVVTRTAANNNHSTYKDYFLVMSASNKTTTDDFAFIIFNFDKKVNKMEFDIAYWSEFDAEQTTKLVLQRKSGDNWVDVKDIKALANNSLEYIKLTIDNLDDQVLRIYAEGVDPTGDGSNGARILFDNMKFYEGSSSTGEDTVAPVISGANDMTFTIGATAPNWLDGVNAVDNVDGNVSVTIVENTVNLQVVGTYKITYQAKDAKGNTAEVTITVTVSEETGELTKAYEFDFTGTNLGTSYKANINVEKTIPNLLGGNANVIISRVAANNNHSIYKDFCLIFSASTKDNDDDFAFVEFAFDNKISKMTFDATFWGSYDVEQTTKIVLQRKSGDNWVDVYDIRQAMDNTLEYKNIAIDNLDDQVLRIYAEGVDPTGSGSNGARFLIDNMIVYTGQAKPTAKSNLDKDLAGLNIISTFLEAGKIDLPSLCPNGSSVAWAYANLSNPNNSLLNLTTKDITMPTSGQVTVTIVATLLNEEYTATKEFNLLIGEGDPITISQVRAEMVGSKVKTQGIVTSVYETTNDIHFFIQDNNSGIYVIAPLTYKSMVIAGNEIILIGVKNSENNVSLLNNVSKVEVAGTKEVTKTSLTNPQDLAQHVGKLVSITGLLTKTYDNNATQYNLVNKLGTFALVIPSNLNSTVKANIQQLLANQETGIAVNITANVYQTGELLLIATNNVAVESAINTTLIKEVILANVTFPNVSGLVTENLVLPTTTNVFQGTTITWQSNNANIISNTGVVTRPDNDTVVRLTYQLKINTSVVGDGYLDATVAKKTSYSGYYASINNLTGAALKTELTRIISNMTSLSYDDARFILDDSDADPNKKGNVILVYNRASVSGVWDGGTTWNREHVWPQSKLGTASNADLHNLKPANNSINSSRGNDPFAEGSGSYGKVTGGWFPGEQDKGDIARIIFYMNTRWGLSISSGVIGNLNTFIKWHNEDPVDDFERTRNEIIYTHQKNRNPYIDHPELVEAVYGKITLSSYQFNNNIEVIEYTINFNKIYHINMTEFERKELYA